MDNTGFVIFRGLDGSGVGEFAERNPSTGEWGWAPFLQYATVLTREAAVVLCDVFQAKEPGGLVRIDSRLGSTLRPCVVKIEPDSFMRPPLVALSDAILREHELIDVERRR